MSFCLCLFSPLSFFWVRVEWTEFYAVLCCAVLRVSRCAVMFSVSRAARCCSPCPALRCAVLRVSRCAVMFSVSRRAALCCSPCLALRCAVLRVSRCAVLFSVSRAALCGSPCLALRCAVLGVPRCAVLFAIPRYAVLFFVSRAVRCAPCCSMLRCAVRCVPHCVVLLFAVVRCATLDCAFFTLPYPWQVAPGSILLHFSCIFVACSVRVWCMYRFGFFDIYSCINFLSCIHLPHLPLLLIHACTSVFTYQNYQSR